MAIQLRHYRRLLKKNLKSREMNFGKLLRSTLKELAMKKHFGPRAELKAILADMGSEGEWRRLMGGNQWQYRSEGGWCLNWWQSTKTISFQGSKPHLAKQRFEMARCRWRRKHPSKVGSRLERVSRKASRRRP